MSSIHETIENIPSERSDEKSESIIPICISKTFEPDEWERLEGNLDDVMKRRLSIETDHDGGATLEFGFAMSQEDALRLHDLLSICAGLGAPCQPGIGHIKMEPSLESEQESESGMIGENTVVDPLLNIFW